MEGVNEPKSDGYTYEEINVIAQHILSRSKHKPKVGIICGSGLGGLADKLADSEILPYESIPNFPKTSIFCHAGKLVLGILRGVPVVCMQGRVHYYEGHPLWKCAMCVRVMKLMGVENLIVTNAAGGLNPDYKVGDLMILKDHLNLHNLGGDSPLRGINDPRFGLSYPPMNNAYDRLLRQRAIAIGQELGVNLHEGVYTMLTGPMYETVAELRALKLLGADAVGMSTIPEVVVARHCGIRVFALSLITNTCIMEADSEDVSHADVVEVGKSREKVIQELVSRMILAMV